MVGIRPAVTYTGDARATTPERDVPGGQAMSAVYPGSVVGVSALRASLRSLLAGFPKADDVVLCGSELAANAATQSRPAMPGGEFTVHAAVIPGCYAWVAVDDDGGPWISLAPRPDTDNAFNHGLDIVRALASALTGLAAPSSPPATVAPAARLVLGPPPAGHGATSVGRKSARSPMSGRHRRVPTRRPRPMTRTGTARSRVMTPAYSESLTRRQPESTGSVRTHGRR